MTSNLNRLLITAGIAAVSIPLVIAEAADRDSVEALYGQANLVAWCVVPFDASNRDPEDRADMLKRLGFTKLAYDWREPHVPTFEAEILALRDQGVEFFAFWGAHDTMFDLFRKYEIAPQVWITMSEPPDGPQGVKVEESGKRLLPLVERTRELGCELGIYNHGGWQGDPANMVAVCEWLRENADADHVGIVYNFHHGHEHMANFAALFEQMKPYLLCLNLNGMVDGGDPKILPLGRGDHELDMMRIVLDSGYTGPIGILDHRSDVDAEESLRENLEGLAEAREALVAE